MNLGALVERLTPALRDMAVARGVELEPSRTARETVAAMALELADRLVVRMCSAVIEQGRTGERLRLTVEQAGNRSRVSMTRPASLAALSEEQLFGGEIDLERGFSLRLVRGLARLAGVDLVAPEGSISLLFPNA